MGDNRVKASMSEVEKVIAPYVKSHLFGDTMVDAVNTSKISMALLRKYKNVEIIGAVEPGPNGRTYMKIIVKGLFGAKEKILIVKGKTNVKKQRRNSSRHWVDDVEEYLAATED